jgi:hypothetical protein
MAAPQALTPRPARLGGAGTDSGGRALDTRRTSPASLSWTVITVAQASHSQKYSMGLLRLRIEATTFLPEFALFLENS